MAKKSANPIDVHVGSRVRLRRMLIGMSQEKLGDTLGLTFQQIQKYEKGLNRIGASRLHEIAKVLEVSVQFFFDDMPGDDTRVRPERSGPEEQRDAMLLELASSPDGLQLSRAFAHVRDPKIRRRILELVRALSGDDEPPAES